jgi:hypothetical protein
VFDKQPDLRLHGIALVNGEPVVCWHCDDGHALEVYKRGFRETWPAFVSCLSCKQGEDSSIITNGLLEAAVAARTGRDKATDVDTFAAEWRGITLEGELIPELIPDDIIAIGREMATAGKQDLRQRKAKVKRQARGWWRGRKKAAQDQVGQVTGRAKAAALSAAWDMQTGDAGPAKQPTRRCRTKGCRGGWVTITSRVHSGSGNAEQVKVPCSTCHRA